MSAATAGAVPVAGPPIANPARDTGEDVRLARLHLRLGMVPIARAELEDLERRGALDPSGLAALAEVRWRGGELDAAAAVATRHLEAGGTALAAIVIAAEAAAAAGDPIEARRLVERAARTDVGAIDAIFGGMPRRASWPASTVPETAAPTAPPRAAVGGPGSGGPTAGGPSTGADEPGTSGQARTPIGGPAPAAPPIRASAVPTPADVLRANAALWEGTQPASPGGPPGSTAAPPGSGRGARPAWVEPARQKGHADPEQELEAARAELGDEPARGLLRLSLVLRLDPTLAPDVFDAIRLRREPMAAIVRGDAERLMGRHLEAEADYGAAMESIEREVLASTHLDEPESHAAPDTESASQEDS